MRANVRNAVRRGLYLDSVALMRLSREIAALSGVEDAALMMATPANRAILAEAGLLDSDGQSAGANDLILAVRAQGAEAADAALAAASLLLERQPSTGNAAVPHSPRSLRSALGAQPGANLALISVPGDYAAAEARKALGCGLDVMIFSDNVPLAEEVALKREGKALGRLVLGPDCGTAIIGGTPLAFANRVPRGDIGLIGASGTGLQEVSCRILAAIDLLDADPATARIVLISKPPHPEVVATVLARVGQSRKRFTVCFLGAVAMHLPRNASAAATLSAAAEDVLGAAIAPVTSPMPAARDGL